MDCVTINAMLATQQAIQTQLTAQVQFDQFAHALATLRLNEAQQKHIETLGALNTHQQQLNAANQMMEMLSQMHAAMMC